VSGENEIACACPRCGSPFTYHVAAHHDGSSSAAHQHPTGHQDIKATASDDASVTSRQGSRGAQNDVDATVASWQNRRNGSADAWLAQASRQDNGGNGSQNALLDNGKKGANKTSNQQKKKSGCGCFLKFFFMLFLACSIIILGVRGCMYFINSDDDEHNVIESMDDGDKASQTDIVVSALSSTDGDAQAPQQAPQWIKGEWEYDTKTYGKITLKIDDSELVEAVDGLESRGTYYCSNDSLYCQFPDEDGVIAYKLDVNSEVIDAGEGMLMTKIK